MDYITYVSTPKNTEEGSPLITAVRLSRGRLSGGFIFFPQGPSGYLHLIVKIGIHQILPYNTGQSYRLNNCIIPIHLDLDLFSPPYKINIITWNDSTEYDHALTVGLFLDPWKRPRVKRGIMGSMLEAVTGYKTGGDRRK